MELLDIAATLVSLAAIFSYLNYRYIRLPSTVGLLVIGLLLSLVILLLHQLGWAVPERLAHRVIDGIDFNATLLHGMLSFLLFAGALHVDLNDLRRQRVVIGVLASAGVLLSTAIVGLLSWGLLGLLGFELPLIYCLLFGALISPTDPIAVLAIMKKAHVPKSLETKIAGESLFNDGIGVVVFLVLLGVLSEGLEQTTVGSVGLLFLEEAVGGTLFGLLIGYIAFRMLRSIDHYSVEVLITLALVMGGYALAHAIHVSGPIAVVVAGLMIGNHGRMLAMSERTREHLDHFWELLDEILNAVLFLLIGLEVLLLPFHWGHLGAGLLMVPLVLFARLASVGLPITLLRRSREFSPNVVKILTWGGLRGGISVALALSLPAGPERELILVLTYIVVIFSIVLQGLTIGRLLPKG